MLTIRHIATTIIPATGDAPERIEPQLDEHGAQIVVWTVAVPRSIEADGAAAIDTYVTNELLSRAEAEAKAAHLATEEASEEDAAS